MFNGLHIVFSANSAWAILNFRAGIIKDLISRGVSVTIVGPFDNDSFSLLQAIGCKVVALPISSRGLNPISDLLLFIRYLYYYSKLKPDLIFHYTVKPNIFGAIAANILRIPSISVITGLGYTFINHNFISLLVKFLYRISLKTSIEVWFLNIEDQEIFLSLKIINGKNCRVLQGEGCDTKHFSPLSKKSNDLNFRFLLAGRMLYDKGVVEFVESAKIVKKIHPTVIFQLVGPIGSANPSAISFFQIEQWASQGLIEYLGEHEDIRQVIRDVDCVVLPSYREGIPRSLMEAASMCKPLIASDVPGCRDIVLPGVTGFLCKVKDPIDLAQKMLEMLALPVSYQNKMGSNARAYIQANFDEVLTINFYIEFIKTLLTSKHICVSKNCK